MSLDPLFKNIIDAHLGPAAPFVVMATIHGPEGWHDVVDGVTGETATVCPDRILAKKIAALLTADREAAK